MIRSGREMQLLHRRLEQFFARWVRLATFAYLRWPHLGVAGHMRPLETLKLAAASGLHALADDR